MSALNGNDDFGKRPHPAHYRLISPDGNAAGTFDTAQEAASAAGGFWPGVGQRGENGLDGWDIEVVR